MCGFLPTFHYGGVVPSVHILLHTHTHIYIQTLISLSNRWPFLTKPIHLSLQYLLPCSLLHCGMCIGIIFLKNIIVSVGILPIHDVLDNVSLSLSASVCVSCMVRLSEFYAFSVVYSFTFSSVFPYISNHLREWFG